jgi:hypothetical protein
LFDAHRFGVLIIGVVKILKKTGTNFFVALESKYQAVEVVPKVLILSHWITILKSKTGEEECFPRGINTLQSSNIALS